ncbi:MAG TPA: DinB family protein [Pyrinomonadaceae bacterium]|nr:DinB family protein [Pyrinomonadaceae bacterium]
MPRIPWIERKFDFNFPVELFPEMIERLRGTPARLTDSVGGLAREVLTRRDGERWSIQENAGHLLDLEALVDGRLSEYEAGANALHAADMTNRKTYDGNHNDQPISRILEEFRAQRGDIVARLDSFEPEMFGRTAWHPRLGVPMRLVDMVFFQAEHDDFHMTRISELIRLFR